MVRCVRALTHDREECVCRSGGPFWRVPSKKGRKKTRGSGDGRKGGGDVEWKSGNEKGQLVQVPRPWYRYEWINGGAQTGCSKLAVSWSQRELAFKMLSKAASAAKWRFDSRPRGGESRVTSWLSVCQFTLLLFVTRQIWNSYFNVDYYRDERENSSLAAEVVIYKSRSIVFSL